MKLILFFCLFGVSVFGAGPPFALLFNYPTNDYSTNITFRVHRSTNVTTPLEAWEVVPVVWSVESTNADLFIIVSDKVIGATPPVTFFAVSASNEWGGPVFSEVVRTAPPRATNLNVRLR